jgi:AAHS family 4-hydroxybenzoate transporter-like MFS transporter
MTAGVNLTGFVDDRRVGAFQYGTVVLCGLVMFFDGFDTQAINYLAPHIAKEWGLKAAVLGPIFSSALVGLMIGYLLLSPFSDRFGHRRLIIAGTALFALASLASVWAGGITELVVLRLVTGIGLGAAAPSAVALTAEYSPKRVRASFVLAIYCGFSLGFVVAGVVSGWLVPTAGWRSVFLVGALAPLVIIPLMLRFLPESLVFLVGRGADAGRAYRLCRRIDPALPETAQPVTVDKAEAGGRVKLRALLANGGVLSTVLLWVVFAINLGEFYALQSWLPTMLTDLGFANGTVVTATSLTTVGGIAVAFVVGPAMDRLGAFGSLGALFVVGAVFLAVSGPAFDAPVWVVLVSMFLVGCGVSGGQKALIALAAVVYPVNVRSTGVGWALGIGRLGGILGPLVVGAAVSASWSPAAVFLALSGPMLVCAVLILYLGRRTRRAADVVAREPVAAT